MSSPAPKDPMALVAASQHFDRLSVQTLPPGQPETHWSPSVWAICQVGWHDDCQNLCIWGCCWCACSCHEGAGFKSA